MLTPLEKPALLRFITTSSLRCPKVRTFNRLSHKHLAISHALPLSALPSPSVTCIRYSDFYAARRSFVFDTVISLRFCQHYHSSNDIACIRYSDFYAAQQSFVFDIVISLKFCQHYHSSNDIACIRCSDFYTAQLSFVFDTVTSLRLCQHYYSSNDIACIRCSDFYSNGYG